MSLAFAMFGAPRYPTEETHHTFPHGSMERTMVRPTPFDDACAEPHEQNNIVLPIHGEHYFQGSQFADPPTSREKKSAFLSDGPLHKRHTPATTIAHTKPALSASQESQQALLFPIQPASPPPAHLLRAGMYANTSLEPLPALVDLDCPTRVDNILRWVG